MFEQEDVIDESSSSEQASQESDVIESESSSESNPDPVAAKAPAEQSIPYERFKEVISERNEFQKQFSALQKRLDAMEAARTQPAQSPKKDFTAKASEIDPEFGEWTKQQSEYGKNFSELQKQFQELQTERLRERATGEVSRLHQEFKVPDQLKSLYEAELRGHAMQNPEMGFEDIAKVYKGIHEKYDSFLSEYKKSALSEYVKVKKADATIPTGKGKIPGKSPAKQDSIPDGVDAKEYLRSEIVKSAMERHRSSKDV